ncbi:hypothetical protein T4B_10458 [Trichinella pseudospiralis]|uniref:Uncharacterized protein n=1 Tax=Trichinella pseudospiralis TaxID=6337 RepID=A0A0V1IJV9_TRIPS|nr:hypothetical protein T4B_10458 [Trichinella pseudospiralis]
MKLQTTYVVQFSAELKKMKVCMQFEKKEPKSHKLLLLKTQMQKLKSDTIFLSNALCCKHRNVHVDVDGSGKQLTLSWTDEEKPDSQTPPWQCCLLYFAGDSFLLKSSEVRL